jgi:hypothetical protein
MVIMLNRFWPIGRPGSHEIEAVRLIGRSSWHALETEPFMRGWLVEQLRRLRRALHIEPSSDIVRQQARVRRFRERQRAAAADGCRPGRRGRPRRVTDGI